MGLQMDDDEMHFSRCDGECGKVTEQRTRTVRGQLVTDVVNEVQRGNAVVSEHEWTFGIAYAILETASALYLIHALLNKVAKPIDSRW